MSDILIKNMEMPKNCRTCPMLFDGHSYRWCNITGESLGIEETDNGRDEYCPLVELPPHGRLIDIDDAIESYGERVELGYVSQSKFLNVVIEAEGSET